MIMTKASILQILFDDSFNLRIFVGVGYVIRNELPMIIGSFAYGNNATTETDCKTMPCHFACIFAYLFTMNHPMDTMSSRYVDIILENGLKIYERVDDDYMNNRNCKLNGIVVDGLKYDLKIVEFTHPNSLSVDEMLRKIFCTRKCALLRANDGCSMLLFKSGNSFHIFDPYMGALNDPQPKAAFTRFCKLNDAIIHIKKRLCLPISILNIEILAWKRIKRAKTAGYFLLTNDTKYRSDAEDGSCKYASHTADEKIDWICGVKTIPWKYTTSICEKRAKWKEYNVVIDSKLYSLYGNVHPCMEMFKRYAGQQYLACSVLALVMAQLYDINEWDDVLLDSIVAHGHKYHIETVSKITEKNYRLKVDELSRICCIADMKFEIKVEPTAYGILYDKIEIDSIPNNLNRTLQYVFHERKLPGVVLQCDGKFLAIGNVENRDYFIFDCQSRGFPVFAPQQGFAYVLKCCCMKLLVACIVLTLNVRRRNVKFFLYEVGSKMLKEKCDKSYANDAKDSTQQEGNGKVSEQISKPVSKTQTVVNSKASSDTSAKAKPKVKWWKIFII